MNQTLKRIGCVSLLLVGAGIGTGCNNNESKSQSSELLTIQSIFGKSVDGSLTTVLASDVVTIVNNVPTVIEDQGVATVRNIPEDPSLSNTSSWMDVIFERYHVAYTRADGRNQEGVDVPYGFDQPMTVNLQVSQSTSFGFTLVRATAKTEPPLVQLAQGPIGEDEISCTATITFFGHDLAGHPVSAQGTIAVNFANWADK